MGHRGIWVIFMQREVMREIIMRISVCARLISKQIGYLQVGFRIPIVRHLLCSIRSVLLPRYNIRSARSEKGKYHFIVW